MRELMAVLRAVSDENRVRILVALDERELCVCQIVELLQLAPSTVSKHLSILKDARLLDARKQGRWIHYRLADSDVLAEAQEATRYVLDSVARSGQAAEDAERLRVILQMDPEKLCRKQCACKK